MTLEEKIRKFREWEFRFSAYKMALAIIDIDKQTVAPPGGAEYRDKRSAYLFGEMFSIATDPEIVALLNDLANEEQLDPETKRAVELYRKMINNYVCVPKDEFVAARELFSNAYTAWLEAKTKKDYSIFEPYLKKIIETQKKQYGYRDSDLPLYDQMLDDYEPGMTMAKYDVFFDAIKERLVPLIRKVTEAKQVDDSFLYLEYPVEGQKKYTGQILAYLGFDPYWGYQNETEHPFTSGTCENDMRTTTKYLDHNVASALFSTIHEVGHATYSHDVDPKYDGTILVEGISSGMHESQSRLFENYLGRTRAFWKANYEGLQNQFPKQLGNITLDQFVDAMNASRPSLVRTEADELTYPIHILIRYEIEKGLFDGTISTEGLDKTWDDMYEKYLGIKAPDAAKGILQDVHWSDGSFGYFPTYALGSAFSAQFVHKMREDMDVDKALAEGHFDQCVAWLKEHIHQYGCRYNAEEIMRMATGEPFDVNYYLDYLEDKYTRLYHLD